MTHIGGNIFMKLNIKKVAPLLIAGTIVLGGCQSVHGQAINENNIDFDDDTTIEFNIDDEDYVSSDDCEELFYENIEYTQVYWHR